MGKPDRCDRGSCVEVDNAVVSAPEESTSPRERLAEARRRLYLPDASASDLAAVVDEAAPGVLRGLRAAGRSVPDDVSVLGLSMASRMAAVCEPVVDHFAPPGFELGRAAALALIDRLEDSTVPPIRTLLACTYSRGDSAAVRSSSRDRLREHPWWCSMRERLEGGPIAEASPVPPPAVLQGRYRLGPEIGRGGASIVYRARDVLLGRDVAVKVFTTRAVQPDDLRSQEGEARLLGGLNHPALVTLLDAGVDLTDATAPQVFLVMEFVDGADLRHRLRRGALSAFEVTYLGWDLLSALEYVHERGIIHRDLKPANVLLTETRGRPARGKLADFGIALLRPGFQDPSEETTGTAAYLSPEQVEGRSLGPATDIYSLGLVLLEAFTSRPSFTGNVMDAAFARLDRDPFIPTDMPPGLAALLRGMTDRSPAARPSAEEAVNRFRELLVDELGGGRPQVRDPEAERVRAVRDLNLLDTPPDAEFDRITRLAARMFEVPVAAVTIVGENRVWLKSHYGLDIQETDRPQGLGTAGGLLEQTTVVEDLSTDARTQQVPSAATSPFRFYAGVPLITKDGHNIGTFAIAHTDPRPMTATQTAALEDLAALALHEIELRTAARRIALGGLRLDQ